LSLPPSPPPSSTAVFISAVDAAVADNAVGGGGWQVFADFVVTAPVRSFEAVDLAILLEDSSNLPFADAATVSLLSSTSTTSSLPSSLS
jgi:hypothetical protein